MDCNDKNDSNESGCLGVILSIILGIATGFLFAYEYIPFISTIIWIIFGLAIFVLGFILIYALMSGITRCNNLSKCFCKNSTSLLGGTLGAIVSIIILLSNVILANSIFTSIMIGLTGFFFVLMLSGLVEVVKCILSCSSCK